MNEKLKTTKIYPLRFLVWEITEKLSEELFLLGSIERGLIIYSDHYNNSPQSSHHAETPHGHTWKNEDSQNIYRKAATTTLNALYLLLWPHLYGVDL